MKLYVITRIITADNAPETNIAVGTAGNEKGDKAGSAVGESDSDGKDLFDVGNTDEKFATSKN